jgi:hypothetical protein
LQQIADAFIGCVGSVAIPAFRVNDQAERSCAKPMPVRRICRGAAPGCRGNDRWRLEFCPPERLQQKKLVIVMPAKLGGFLICAPQFVA